MSEPAREAGLAAFETALAALRPTADTIPRDLFLYRAGQSSVRRPSRLWPAATVVMAVLVAVQFFAHPRPVDRMAVVPSPTERDGAPSLPVAATEWPRDSNLILRSRLAVDGVEAMRPSIRSTGMPATLVPVTARSTSIPGESI